MPETTSPVALTVLHLINTMHTSPNNTELPAIANPVEARNTARLWHIPASAQNVNRKTTECISSSKMRGESL
ncbi:MAG: hypothetical protein DMG84_23450 [Acidobacteria bacterium]|nr:MAG: hypothetical protein DMG84_23450 [Acidobacteriota bacterium]